MNMVFEEEIRLIGDSLRSLDEGAFNALLADCGEAISNNGRIIATGLGKNVPVCEKFVGTMTSLGIPASFMHTNSAIHGDLGMVSSKDLVILLTKSGETVESVALAALLKERGCGLWLLTFSPKSTLTEMAPKRLVLELEHEGDLWNIVPNNSSIVNLIVLQKLCIELSRLLAISLGDFKKNHPGGHIGKLLK